jgi:hypothetical protein
MRWANGWLFPVRGLAQWRLAFDWNGSCGANENATDPFYREAVIACRPAFLSRRLPPSPLSSAAPCTARRKIQAPHPTRPRAGTDGLLAPRNSGGIAAPEGRRYKVSGARRVGAG